MLYVYDKKRTTVVKESQTKNRGKKIRFTTVECGSTYINIYTYIFICKHLITQQHMRMVFIHS